MNSYSVPPEKLQYMRMDFDPSNPFVAVWFLFCGSMYTWVIYADLRLLGSDLKKRI